MRSEPIQLKFKLSKLTNLGILGLDLGIFILVCSIQTLIDLIQIDQTEIFHS